MTTEPAPQFEANQLPEAARDRIEKLRLLFVERCKENVVFIRSRMEANVHRKDPDTFCAEIIPVLHSLVGTAGIFGYRELSDTTAIAKNLLRQPGGFKSNWVPALNLALAHLDALNDDAH